MYAVDAPGRVLGVELLTHIKRLFTNLMVDICRMAVRAKTSTASECEPYQHLIA